MAVSSFSNSGIRSGVKRNKFWDQSAVENSFFSIETVTVGAGGSQYIDFTNIPQTYTHLQIRGIGRDTRAISGMGGEVRLWFNSDTGTNYSSHIMYSNGAGAYAGNYVNNPYIYCFDTVSGSSTANTFSGGIIDILDYSNTNKFKTTRSIGGGDLNGSGVIGIYSGNWRNTNAITSIRLSNTSGTYNFAQYTTFALYGIKG